MELCDYGCGNKANFDFKNGKSVAPNHIEAVLSRPQ